MRQTRILNLVIALSVIFFGWRSYEAWTKPVTVVTSPSPGTSVTPIGAYQPDSPAVPADLSANVALIVARPVFRPDRKPFSEGGIGFSQRNYDVELSKLTLVGVLQMGDDKKGIVVGKGAGTRDERWEVGPGDTLPGFRVKDVGVEGMTLTADGREFLLPLYAGGPKGTAGQATVRTEGTPQRPPTSPSQPPAAGQARRTPPGGQAGRVSPAGQAGSVPAAGQSGNVFPTGQTGNTPASIYQTLPTTPPPAAGTTSGEDTMNYGGGRRVRPSPGRR
ncbi:MAG: hypothetical protein HW377_1365 [Actinobacteria bacterium]|nr:hypothetical protein [Actinomycetota bacterium]